MDPQKTTKRAQRGRVVMLVDNGVEGDSRVQKEARSAAERGWDVVLLGCSPDGQTRRSRFGDARIRLVPMPKPMARRRYEYRRALLREPLAYPEGPLAPYLQQKARARQVDIATKRAAMAWEIRTGARSGAAAQAARAWIWGQRAYAKAAREFVDLRVARTRALRQRRKRMDSPLDKFTTRFWEKAMGCRAWRKLDPGLWDWELAFGPVVDELAPDLIHANDGRMLGVAARAALRARLAGRDVKLVWDAHEFLPGRYIHGAHPRWHVAACAHEAEFVSYADAVVTVSENMVELLTETYGLSSPPVIVRNAPTVGLEDSRQPSIRVDCGLEDDVPLLIYIGAMAPQRGVDLMVECLPRLPGVHVAFVARQSRYVESLVHRARELGVEDRLHVVPYVHVDQIVHYISSADVGVFPAVHVVNHDVDLPTKFYEYLQARLPMVVSDVRTTAETTRRIGQGEVFRAEDAEDYVRAVRAVLSDPDRYRAAIDRSGLREQWTWERQADVLDKVYSSLLGR